MLLKQLDSCDVIVLLEIVEWRNWYNMS